MTTKLDTRTLAEVTYSSAITLTMHNSRPYFENDPMKVVPKVISFNLQGEHDIIVGGDKLAFDSKNNKYLRSKEEIVHAVEERIKELMVGKNVEFVYQDPITKCVIVFMEDYVDKLLSGEEYIGTLILNYFKQWHTAKCGPSPKTTREHHERFKTFSQNEIDYLKRMYIPIMVAPKGLKPIFNSIMSLIASSPLTDFIIKDVGYNVSGRRTDSAITIWVPRMVAKEYLDEQDDFKVLSYRVLEKMVRDAGLLDTPPVKNPKIINKSIMEKQESEAMANEYILSKNKERNEAEIKPMDYKSRVLISEDKDVSDNLIPEDAPLLTLDYY